MKFNYVLLFLLVLSNVLIYADETVTATVTKNRFSIDDSQVVLSLNIKNGNGSEILNIPTSDAFKLVEAGTSSYSQLINGNFQSSLIHNYIIVPKKTGVTTIEAIAVVKDGKTYYTSPIKLEITPSNATNSVTGSVNRSSNDRNPGGDELKIELSWDKTDLYVDEPVMMRFKILKRKDVQISRRISYDLPKPVEFIAEKDNQINDTVILNGVEYGLTEMQTVMYPTKTGEYEVGPGWLGGEILRPQVRNSRGGSRLPQGFENFDSLFGDAFSDDPFSMFGGSYAREPFKLKSNTVKIKVLPLPDSGKPADFSGTVGNYRLNVEYSNLTNLKRGDAITLTMVVEGAGHLNTINEPRLTGLDNFKAFDSEVSIVPLTEGQNIAGQKIFKKVIVPSKAGKIKLPDVDFNFFDPTQKKYVTLRKEGAMISLADVKETEFSQKMYDAASQAQQSKSKLSPEITHKDIIFIQTSVSVLRKDPAPFDLKEFLSLLAAGPLVYLLLYFPYAYRRRLQDNPAWRRNKQGYSVFWYSLKGIAFHEAEAKKACFDLSKALSDYFADKMNLPKGTWTVREVNNYFEKADVPEPLRKKFIKHLEMLDQYQYGLSQLTQKEWKQLTQDVKETVKELEGLNLWKK